MPEDKNPYQSDLHRNTETMTLLDPYLDWAEAQGIPLHLDFGHDLLALETKPWGFYEARGCFAHTHGRGDFMACYVLEVPAGSKTRPVNHVYEAFFYTLSGHGSTTVWMPNGEKRTFEWGPRAVFAIPLNCKYQIFNGSGSEAARVSCTNDLPMTMNLFHNEEFIFDNDFPFPERTGRQEPLRRRGQLHPDPVGCQHVGDQLSSPISPISSSRSSRSGARARPTCSSSSPTAPCMPIPREIPKGRYKKAHRHAAGTHVHAVSGEGYSLLWYQGDSEFVEIPWRHGIMYTPPFWMFHQHFNTWTDPARYFACSLGSRRYPILGLRRRAHRGWPSCPSTRAAARSSTRTRIRASIANGWMPSRRTA